MIAVESIGSISLPMKRSAISVAVEPTGSKVAVTGIRVSIEPMWWWSRISTISACSTPGHALGGLGVVDEDHPARLRRDEVAAGQQADRPVPGVDRDCGPVVDVLDLLGDVDDQVVGIDGQRRSRSAIPSHGEASVTIRQLT